MSPDEGHCDAPHAARLLQHEDQIRLNSPFKQDVESPPVSGMDPDRATIQLQVIRSEQKTVRHGGDAFSPA